MCPGSGCSHDLRVARERRGSRRAPGGIRDRDRAADDRARLTRCMPRKSAASRSGRLLGISIRGGRPRCTRYANGCGSTRCVRCPSTRRSEVCSIFPIRIDTIAMRPSARFSRLPPRSRTLAATGSSSTPATSHETARTSQNGCRRSVIHCGCLPEPASGWTSFSRWRARCRI